MFTRLSLCSQARNVRASCSRMANLRMMSRPQPQPFMAPSMRIFSSSSDNFMSGNNANYIDFMYSQWKADPSSVHASWNAYFANGNSSFSTPPTLGQTSSAGADVNSILQAL